MKLEKVVARTGTNIPPDRMYLMKASEKTNGLNAYVSGIGATKRIVVWDTTAGRIPDDEVLFIFGHESGHYVLHHIPEGICLHRCGAVLHLLGLRGVRGVDGEAVWGEMDGAQTGRSSEQHRALSSRTGFVVLLFAISIASFFWSRPSTPSAATLSTRPMSMGRRRSTASCPTRRKTAVAAFNALGQAWLEDPNPSPFIEFWLYNHPSTEHRANFALHYDPWANGGHGEFFKN